MLRKEKTTVPQSSKENTGVVDGKNDKEEYQDDKGDDKGWVELQGADHGGGKIFKGWRQKRGLTEPDAVIKEDTREVAVTGLT